MHEIKEAIRISEAMIGELNEGGRYTKQDIELVGALADIIKDLVTVCAMNDAEMDSGYSGEWRGSSMGYSRNRYSNGMHYDGGTGIYDEYDPMHSGRRGRSQTTGRYMSRGEGRGYSSGRYNGYSRDDAKMRLTSQLERLMDESQDEATKAALDDALKRIER